MKSSKSAAFFILVFSFSAPLFAAEFPCSGEALSILNPKLSKIAEIVKRQDGAGLIAQHLDALSDKAKESYEDAYYQSKFSALRDELEKPCAADWERETLEIYDELLSEPEVVALYKNGEEQGGASPEWPEGLTQKMETLLQRKEEQRANLLKKISAFYIKQACAIVHRKLGPKEIIKIKSTRYINESRTIYVYEECKVEADAAAPDKAPSK